MIDKKVKTALIVGIIGTYIAFSYSVSTIFMTFLTGVIFIPPMVVFVYVLREGIPLMFSELKEILNSGKEIFVISYSKEHITLEPQYK